MARRMLIDATHPEETRVAVVSGNRLEEFDFETASKKQLKGNIYLARVTRVEPSLQAAFVEYGGNRHGFLAFSEIHPDYYRIPIADREALIEEEKAENAELDDREQNGDGASVETVGGDLEEEQMPRRAPKLARQYKIQEVITRRQVMLVQVTKEERGNKGAALTTYLSLAGRYCVLMPNTPRGGGISRKISNAADRKKMRSILDDLMVPDGMAVILRTAGVERTKSEIKRDLDYLMRLWESIRELTLKSMAPTIIHEEANLIKRAIRDLYSRDIDEVIFEGDEGYKTAKAFMKMLMPSHAKKVQSYKDDLIPLFHRYQVENQIEALHSPTVQLKSGGYIVINPTEALVAIDVNSGKSTRERNIEETAYRTNLEAADEVARQLRLRDLAGLIVVDFIDMEEDRHNNAVERRLKDAMKSDRARVQLGRISHFGLLELSRQRLRPSLLEAHFEVSPYCGGTGMIRTVESSALVVLRAIVEEGTRQRSSEITVKVPTNVALYILNHKRDALAQIEQRYGLTVMLEGDESLYVPNFELLRSRGGGRPEPAERAQPVDAARILEESDAEAEDEEDQPQGGRPDTQEAAEDEGGDGQGRSKRRRRPRRRRRPEGGEQPQDQAAEATADQSEDEETGEAAAAGSTDDQESGDEKSASRGRRRGRRGGRGRSRRRSSEVSAETGDDREDDGREPDIRDDQAADSSADSSPDSAAEAASEQGRPEAAGEEKPKRKRPPRKRKAPEKAPEPVAEAANAEGSAQASETDQGAGEAGEPTQADASPEPAAEPATEAKPKRRRSPRRKTDEAKAADAGGTADEAAPTEAAEPAQQAGGDSAPTTADAPAEEKPKRQRRARKPKAKEEPAAGEPPAEDASAGEPADVDAPAATSAEPEAPAPSSGNGSQRREEPAPAGHGEDEADDNAATSGETVNQKPERPKRGWWRRMMEG